MSTPLPVALSADLQIAQASNPASEKPVCTCADPTINKVFKDILADENLLSETIGNLKQLLSGDEFAKLEEILESGKDLPIAAMFSPDNELIAGLPAAIPQIMQEFSKLEGQLVSSFMASAQRLSDSVTQQAKDVSARAIDNLGRQVSEAIAQVGDASNGTGKNIQELLQAMKTEFPVLDAIPRAMVPAAIGSEAAGSAIPNINTAISGLAQMPNFQVSAGSPQPPAIAPPMGEQGWGEAMGERIMWMMGKGIQGASIRINPPHLGPIQVQLSVQNDQASVNMVAQHGVVKEALEAALPRLREMLAESNMQLVNVDVSHRENAQHGDRSELFQQHQNGPAEQFLTEQHDAAPAEEEVTTYYTSSGLLDDYA